jgi:hypothetical protein
MPNYRRAFFPAAASSSQSTCWSDGPTCSSTTSPAFARRSPRPGKIISSAQSGGLRLRLQSALHNFHRNSKTIERVGRIMIRRYESKMAGYAFGSNPPTRYALIDANSICAVLRKKGSLLFPDWEAKESKITFILLRPDLNVATFS